MNAEAACVLVVEDDELNRDLLVRRLEQVGHQAVTAVNGHDALAKLEAHSFDLILLDIMMPEMNGYEVLTHLKASDFLKHIPVIVISIADDINSIVKGIELGAEDYLTKPFHPPLLYARIQACLDKKQLHDQEQNRLQEMVIMQQIDAELNATLDMKRVMDITLTWAMDQTRSEAGFMGILADHTIQIMAAQGYTYELYEGQQTILPDELPAVAPALEDCRLAYVPQTQGAGLLARTESQMALPLCRESAVVAILVLESTQANQWSEETHTFLQRLGSHAAIAIANAQLYKAVQTANEAKTEFVSFVSHELKIPMTSIKGYADLLLSCDFGPINEAQSSFLNTIRNNVDRMNRLVSDLADVSHLEAGKLRLETQPVVLAEVINEVVLSTQEQVKAKAQQLIVELPERLPEVWGDRVRLVQILTNLVSNAHKYTPENGRIAICAEEMNSVNDDAQLQPMVHVSVADTGLGIKEEEQKAIFTKFFRADDDQALKSPGTGLGLNITKNLVDLHNGRIWFESQYRQGTTFHFIIPVANGQTAEDD